MTKAQEERMTRLVVILNEAAYKYYEDTTDGPSISDAQYDKLLKELVELEAETGISLPSSPTNKVGYPYYGRDKMPHKKPILSLKDTKNIQDLLYFLGEREGLLSWKLDGLSIILHYINGRLVNALTRGDGVFGRVIFEKALRMASVPKEIACKDELFVRGEGCITLSEFDAIKKTKTGEQFSNPRNLAAGIINTTKSQSVLLRHVTFVAHSIVYLDGIHLFLKRREQLDYLSYLGFCVVPYTLVLNFELIREIERYTKEVETFDFPVDGLVLTLNDISYANSLGATARYPKHSMAFKWPDESKLTKVIGMKWSVSKTGLITPVVIFEPVELEGTNVRQANLHTLKKFEELALGKGDILRVYKANKIIPEVDDNITRSGTEIYPHICPICGGKTTVVENETTRKLYCHRCGGKEV